MGVSSIQLNNLSRGFSFRSKENLDMKMGLSSFSAQEAVNNLSEQQLKLVIKVLGEEREAAKIAKNIVRVRSKKKITKVSELVKIIEQSKKKVFLDNISIFYNKQNPWIWIFMDKILKYEGLSNSKQPKKINLKLENKLKYGCCQCYI